MSVETATGVERVTLHTAVRSSLPKRCLQVDKLRAALTAHTARTISSHCCRTLVCLIKTLQRVFATLSANRNITLHAIWCSSMHTRMSSRRCVCSVRSHKNQLTILQVKDESLWPASELDTILHPNTYFKRSFMLKNLGKVQSGDIGVDGPTQSSATHSSAE